MTAGYSGTPLAKKLGIGAGHTVFVSDAPAGYRKRLEPMPAKVRFVPRVSKGVDLAHVFVTRHGDLRRALVRFRKTLAPSATVWVSWPKKAANIASEVTEDTVRALALPLGFVDVKVCAVDDVWSGLKLVVRKTLRGRDVDAR